MEDRRKESRETASEEIRLSVNVFEYNHTKWVETKGMLLNKSEKGLCIITPFALETGHVLLLNNHEIGLVKWARREDSHTIAGVLRKGKIHGLSED